LAIKEQFDKLGANIAERAVPPPGSAFDNTPLVSPYQAREDALNSDRLALNSGAFFNNARKIAQNDLKKTMRDANTWAAKEQNRFESLLNIRDANGNAVVSSIMKEAEEAYDKVYDSTKFVTDSRGRISHALEPDKKSAGDRAANEIIDKYISDGVLSYQTQEEKN
jgi:hypothetical protein